MTNHKKLIDVTASLDRKCLSFKIDQSKNAVTSDWHGSCMLLLVGPCNCIWKLKYFIDCIPE